MQVEKESHTPFPTAIEQGAVSSKLQQSLFDPDYDDFDSSKFDLDSLLSSTGALADTKEESKPRSDNFVGSVSDLSSLFGEDSNPAMSLGQSNFGLGNHSSAPSYNQGQTVIKAEVKQEVLAHGVKQEHRVKQERERSSSSPYKSVKKEEKRRSAEKTVPPPTTASGDTKKRASHGLFSPESDRGGAPARPSLPPLQSPLRSPPPVQGERARTASTSSNGTSEQPVVNVQKLESIAPEFQRMLKDTSSSILVTPDGQPSPRKREEERRREQEKRGREEKDKKRSSR